MSSRLRLVTLEDLENQQSQQVNQHQYRQLNQERYQDQADQVPKFHCHVGQILYAKDVYKDYPTWKRWAALHVHIPLFRWFEKALGLFPPTGRDVIKGVYVWNAHQGCFASREDADKDAARYAHGYVVPNMPLGQSLTESVPEKSSIYFAQDAAFHVDMADLAPLRERLEVEVKELKDLGRTAARINL
jgi:hypothetical protein